MGWEDGESETRETDSSLTSRVGFVKERACFLKPQERVLT